MNQYYYMAWRGHRHFAPLFSHCLSFSHVATLTIQRYMLQCACGNWNSWQNVVIEFTTTEWRHPTGVIITLLIVIHPWYSSVLCILFFINRWWVMSDDDSICSFRDDAWFKVYILYTISTTIFCMMIDICHFHSPWISIIFPNKYVIVGDVMNNYMIPSTYPRQ